MRQAIDMTGWNMWEHGIPDSRLIVVKRAEDHIDSKGIRHIRWLCQCSCGSNKTIIADAGNIRFGTTKSCGCIRSEKVAERSRSRHKINTYNLDGEYGIGFTSNTNREFYFDLNKYDIIKDYCWCERIEKSGYSSLIAWDKENERMIKMTDLLGFKNYDHINRNSLDNRECNLRKATILENSRNRSKTKRNKSGFIGVYWIERCKKWRSSIGINHKLIYLGYYVNIRDAIIARLKAELQYFGEFAPQSHLFKEYGIKNN
jgi:hypothetical protein